MKHIIAVVVTLLLCCPASGFSETKEIVAEGAYNMGDGETPTVAESRALLQAKRTAVEEAGTYVESYSKTRNFQLTVDEIQVLASGIMEVEVLEKKRTVVGDGFNFWIKIKARVSTDKMEEMAKRVKEKSVVEDYKRIQEAYDKSQKDIEELKRQLAGAKGEKEKKQVEARIADDERLFQANEWFEKGYNYLGKNEPDKAIEAYSRGIAINPNNATSYATRGIAYLSKGQYGNAIEDCDEAIAINPNSFEAYFVRGMVYENSDQYDKAIDDYSKAIAMDPNNGEFFKHRSIVYYKKGQFGKALDDYNKATGRDYYLGYLIRGFAFAEKDMLDSALEEFSKAISVNPKRVEAYYYQSGIYLKKGLFDKAIEVSSMVLSIDPSYAEAYYDRGVAYEKKGLHNRSINDFKKACDLGNELGCGNAQKLLSK